MRSLNSSAWFNSAAHAVDDRSTQRSSSRPSFPQKQTVWSQFWDQLINRLTLNPNEPHVWHTVDRMGQTIWHAYDPLTHRTLSCASETEMRQWLEERYYHQAKFSLSTVR
jgi:hypothetical protein